MAYSAVAQAERHLLSDDTPLISASPQPNHIDSAPLSPTLNSPAHNVMASSEQITSEAAISQMQSILRSFTSTHSSYAMVDSPDHGEHHISPLSVKKRRSRVESIPAGTDDTPPSSPPFSPPNPMRTASISRGLPLNHPTPDLQSLQGAYVKNVERLEESAERLSMTSSLEEELQKMKLEQKLRQRQFSAPVTGSPHLIDTSRQFSTGSFTNSIIGVNTAARSGGYSPGGYVTSPKESVLSGSWSQPSNLGRLTSRGSRVTSRLSEPEYSAAPVDNSSAQPISSLAASLTPLEIYEAEEPAAQRAGAEQLVERSSTSASTDTYRQATSLFVDFDGVHYVPRSQLSRSQQGSLNRHVSLTQPPLASDAKAFQEPPPGERMVYYPAPVPMVLNLPQKLSFLPSAAEREKRRLKAINEMPDNMRNAAGWLRNDNDPAFPARSGHNLGGLPPQLRANAFFDQPAQSMEIEVKGGSAVATLDSILDASAHAPVSAFTDHPIVGHLGKEVYGKAHKTKAGSKVAQKKLQSSSNAILRNNTGISSTSQIPPGPSTMSHARITSRESKAIETEMEMEGENMSGEHSLFRHPEGTEPVEEPSILPDADEAMDEFVAESEGHESEEDGKSDTRGYAGPPTTLLAELQMRKAQQKQRNRTAATAFPNGMHSTLLELDAVAQLQQKSRKQKHIALAWEDHDLADRQNFDDEDVPLGLLFNAQKPHNNVNRPIGLMEKREMEDNEPLSARRNRLRGDVPTTREGSLVNPQGSKSLYALEVPGLHGSQVAEEEGETLGQRIKRLKEEKAQSSTMNSDFAKGASHSLGLNGGDTVIPSKTPNPEETLGQRRKRLKEEALMSSRQVSGGSSGPTTSLKPQHSMASILSAHPAGGGGSKAPDGSRGLMANATMQRQGTLMENRNGLLPSFQPAQMVAPTVMGGVPTQQYQAFSTGMPFTNHAFQYGNPMLYNPALGMQMGGYGPQGLGNFANDVMMGPPLDPKQRDMIDQWRQSVVR